MEFSRQEYWNGLPFPSPGDLPDPGIKPQSPASQADALPSEPPGKGEYCYKQQMGMKGVWAVFLFFSFVNVISSITLPQYNLFWNNKLPEISWCHREKKRDIKDQFNVSFWFLLFLCSVLGLELQFHHICGLFPNCSYLWGRIDWEALLLWLWFSPGNYFSAVGYFMFCQSGNSMHDWKTYLISQMCS